MENQNKTSKYIQSLWINVTVDVVIKLHIYIYIPIASIYVNDIYGHIDSKGNNKSLSIWTLETFCKITYNTNYISCNI